MNVRELAYKHRFKLLPTLVLLALAVVGLRFRGELGAWFSPAMPAPTAVSVPANASADTPGHAAPNTEAKAPPGLPAHQFAAAPFEFIKAALSAYEQARALLAKDSQDGLDAQAKAIGAGLEAARNAAPDLPQPIAAVLADAAQAAGALSQATDTKSARMAFGDLSKALVGLLASDPRLAEGLHVFTCPMTEGFAKWFQPSPQLENPYMGQQMLTCGSESNWVEPMAPMVEHPHEDGADDIAFYTCPMHPSVKQDAPGKCPICGMELTPVTKRELESGTIYVDAARRQLIGVRTEAAAKRALTLKIRAVGAVRFDETRLHDVNLRMSGWVQHLAVNETGQRVSAGQTLFTLYSPELYAAQLEHLATMQRQAEGGTALFASLGRASRQRLRLLGMSEKQVSELEQKGEAVENVPIPAPASGYVIEKDVVEGARVEAGMRVYRIADLSKVWIDAELYESDLPQVRVGQAVEVELPYQGTRQSGKVDYIYPTLQGQTRTGRARVVLNNPKLTLKPDMYVNVLFDVELGERLTIPDSAVVYTGPRRLVFVDLGEGKLKPKLVKLGSHVDGYYEVLEGVAKGDVVVTSGNFLIAAESRIRSAAQFWEAE